MVKVVYTNHFLKSARKLPALIKEKSASSIEVLQKNPFDSTLHTKSLTGKLAGFYSFRITRDWRVIFYFLNPETVKLIDVAHRKDIYR